MSHRVVCISREFGSGGHVIGAKLAERLGVAFYDKNLLEMAVEYGEIKSGALDKADEKASRPWFYKLLYEGNDKVQKEQPASETLFQLQRDLIREIAKKEDCVIAGRCCDEILRDQDVKMLSVYVVAPLEYRIQHKMEQEHLSRKDAVTLVRRVDKERAYYYNYYAKKEWGDPLNYDITFNSEKLGADTVVDILEQEFNKL